MANITAADVSKLRQMTGAGMMDCKKALVEAEGDFERAKELIRERGLAIANKRLDREASQGAVLSKSVDNHTVGVIIALNCETDFVAKNADFVNIAKTILDVAAKEQPANIDELKNLKINNQTISDLISEKSGITGEKMELAYYDIVKAAYVSSYIHMGNKLATLVGLNKATTEEVAYNIAMQVAALNPLAIDKEFLPQELIDKELEIGREQARNEGKAEELLNKIAQGKLSKFIKESTLLNQDIMLDDKMSVKEYLKKQDKELTVISFKRYALSN